jgi:ketosteroid isomerase-like protein
MKWNQAGALLLFAGLGACAQPPAAPAVDLAAEEQAIRAASAAWLAAAQAKDWASAAANFADDGVAHPENAEPLVGPAANQASMEAQAAKSPNATISWTTTKVVVAASGDLAYELGTYTSTNEGEEERGNFVTVWQKTAAGWKVAADMGVSSMPEPDSTKKPTVM